MAILVAPPLLAKAPALIISQARTPAASSICLQCRRSFVTTRPSFAGHNKWSKTKHIKAVTDKKKTLERTAWTKAIALYSRLYGDNIKFNPQLANAIAQAAKASVPKALIETAVARGQGRSVSGAQLESITLEILMPPNIAMIAYVETDNKMRTIHDLRHAVKKNGGVVGSTTFYFSKRGRAIFKCQENGPSLSEVLEEALEHEGTEDVEEMPDGSFQVWTQAPLLMAITEALTKKFELELLDSDVIWAPNEDTKVDVDEAKSVDALDALLSSLREYTEVKAMYANIRQGSITSDEWDRIERHIDA